jgi:hypothetical protein
MEVVRMRAVRYVALLLVLATLLTLAAVGDASASSIPTPTVIQPKITAVSSSTVCAVFPCAVTVTVTYNVPVGFTANVYRAFTVIDETLGTTFTTLNVTPSPLVAGANQLLVHVSCDVNGGDKMQLDYTAFLPPSPVPVPGYVYSLALPHTPALSPQIFDWIQGPTTGCPPICPPAA